MVDGIQGPMYVRIGCVFRRQALYGYDAPTMPKSPTKPCNCWPKPCCFYCGSEREGLKAKKKQENKKDMKHRDSSKKILALEYIKGNVACELVPLFYGCRS